MPKSFKFGTSYFLVFIAKQAFHSNMTVWNARSVAYTAFGMEKLFPITSTTAIVSGHHATLMFLYIFELHRDDKGHLWNLFVAAEKKAEIKAAIAKVQSGAGGCIKFVEVEKSSSQFKLSITPFNPDKWVEQSYVLKMSTWSTHGFVIIWIHSSKAERCSSYPGRYLRSQGCIVTSNVWPWSAARRAVSTTRPAPFAIWCVSLPSLPVCVRSIAARIAASTSPSTVKTSTVVSEQVIERKLYLKSKIFW